MQTYTTYFKNQNYNGDVILYYKSANDKSGRKRFELVNHKPEKTVIRDYLNHEEKQAELMFNRLVNGEVID